MIKRINHGYEITIPQSAGTCVLHVYDNGVVEDMSGAPVYKSDVGIAITSVPDKELKTKIAAWWAGHSGGSR